MTSGSHASVRFQITQCKKKKSTQDKNSYLHTTVRTATEGAEPGENSNKAESDSKILFSDCNTIQHSDIILGNRTNYKAIFFMKQHDQ